MGEERDFLILTFVEACFTDGLRGEPITDREWKGRSLGGQYETNVTRWKGQ